MPSRPPEFGYHTMTPARGRTRRWTRSFSASNASERHKACPASSTGQRHNPLPSQALSILAPATCPASGDFAGFPVDAASAAQVRAPARGGRHGARLTSTLAALPETKLELDLALHLAIGPGDLQAPQVGIEATSLEGYPGGQHAHPAGDVTVQPERGLGQRPDDEAADLVDAGGQRRPTGRA